MQKKTRNETRSRSSDKPTEETKEVKKDLAVEGAKRLAQLEARTQVLEAKCGIR